MSTAFTIEFVLYLVTCKASGKLYVGQTSQSLKKRWAHHLYMAKTGKGNGCSALHGAMQKYGVDQFEVEEIGRFSSREELNAAEAEAIIRCNSRVPNGYNLKSGGEAGDHSSVTKAKMSAVRKAQGNFRAGTKHSSETKARMRAAQLVVTGRRRGWQHTDELKAQIVRSTLLAKHWRMR